MGIAKSIAKWTINNFTDESFNDYIEKATLQEYNLVEESYPDFVGGKEASKSLSHG